MDLFEQAVQAILDGDEATLARLLREHPDLIRGETGLHWAAYGGHTDIVRLLLAHHAPVHVKDERWSHTPLGWARFGQEHPPDETRAGNWDEVFALLEAAEDEPEDGG